jgi:hypothetical protein
MSYLGYLERLPTAIVIAGEVAMVPIVVTIVTVVPIAMPIMPAGHGHRNQAAGEEDADRRSARGEALHSCRFLPHAKRLAISASGARARSLGRHRMQCRQRRGGKGQ